MRTEAARGNPTTAIDAVAAAVGAVGRVDGGPARAGGAGGGGGAGGVAGAMVGATGGGCAAGCEGSGTPRRGSEPGTISPVGSVSRTTASATRPRPAPPATIQLRAGNCGSGGGGGGSTCGAGGKSGTDSPEECQRVHTQRSRYSARTASVALWPPKPNELDSATRTLRRRITFGTQ